MKTLWILQKNIYTKHFEKIREVLEEINRPYMCIDVIPFSTELDFSLSYNGPIIAYGSTTLIKLSPKDWSWYNEDIFKPSIWGNKIGEKYINHDAEIMRLDEVLKNWRYDRAFIRPNSDLKLFSGDVFMKGDFIDWYDRLKFLIEDGTYINIKLDTMVSVASYKRIILEWRFFVVNKEVIAGSQYRKNGKLDQSNLINPNAMLLADKIAGAEWQLDTGYVVDIGLTEDGKYKVIEFNNFNASGFYECNIKDILLKTSLYLEDE